ncbi:hypothetical protein [Couchioplanes azureus]|uniref:hypothetical protein n=1 Tax=Couchioplanes caeruleus TaxID=56438 RepID=UPI00167023A8|nr:hypothetical protein [Couchioplanes caeruleus]
MLDLRPGRLAAVGSAVRGRVPPGEFGVDVALIQMRLAPVGGPVAPVRCLVAFAGCMVAPVGGEVAFAGYLVAPVRGLVAFAGCLVTFPGCPVAPVGGSITVVGGLIAHGGDRLALFRVDVALVGVALPGVARRFPLGRASLPPLQFGATDLILRHAVILGALPPRRNLEVTCPARPLHRHCLAEPATYDGIPLSGLSSRL